MMAGDLGLDWNHAAAISGASSHEGVQVAALASSMRAGNAVETLGNAANHGSRGVGAVQAGCAPIVDPTTGQVPAGFETPTDGLVGEIFRKVGNAAQTVGWAVNRVAGHAWDLAKLNPVTAPITRGVDYLRETVRYWDVAKIEASSLKPGDVILFRSVSPVSTGIQVVTSARFNHAAIYAGMKDGVPQIIDATDFKGIACRPLAEAMKGRTSVVVLRNPHLNDAQRAAVVSAAEKFLGGAYSNASALGGGTLQHIPGKDTNARDKMCSELVFDTYFNALGGARVTTGNMPNPGELGRSGYFNVAGRLI